MDTLLLQAQPRAEVGKIVDRLRRANKIPAIVYGHHTANRPVTLEMGNFSRVYRQAGSTSLVDVKIGNQPVFKALIHAVQYHPTKSVVTHIDLYQVKMSEKLEADIELKYVGESPAVKELGGILVRTMDKIRVSCLPSDLSPAIDVDISVLKNFEDRIHVKDIMPPTGITILDKADEVVASVTPPRSEEELASLSEQVEENVEAVEVAAPAPSAEETPIEEQTNETKEK